MKIKLIYIYAIIIILIGWKIYLILMQKRFDLLKMYNIFQLTFVYEFKNILEERDWNIKIERNEKKSITAYQTVATINIYERIDILYIQ